MWKFHYYSTPQILREINSGEPIRGNSANLSNLESQSLDFYVFLHFLLAKNEINKVQSKHKAYLPIFRLHDVSR